jgi:hypothetical protein
LEFAQAHATQGDVLQWLDLDDELVELQEELLGGRGLFLEQILVVLGVHIGYVLKCIFIPWELNRGVEGSLHLYVSQ